MYLEGKKIIKNVMDNQESKSGRASVISYKFSYKEEGRKEWNIWLCSLPMQDLARFHFFKLVDVLSAQIHEKTDALALAGSGFWKVTFFFG